MPAVERQRTMITNESRPGLPSFVRLQFEPVRGAWALLSPEKVMWPDDVSHDILKRCNGKMTVAEIISSLAAEYDAPEAVVGDDVSGFLQTWADRRLVIA
nr:coenzyme PQQ synthesis protein D [uncultured bacterium]